MAMETLYPASNATEVTASDATTYSPASRALYVGGAGDLDLVMESGNEITMVDVPAGAWLPIRVKKIMAATTATNIVLFY